MVDSNIVLDVVGADQKWLDWSKARLEEARRDGDVLLDPIAFAEVSVRLPDVAAVEHVMIRLGARLAGPDKLALFAAGKAFAAYRNRGGSKTGVLADFLIGANALVRTVPLLTRDVGRYRTYFPALELISPDTHP